MLELTGWKIELAKGWQVVPKIQYRKSDELSDYWFYCIGGWVLCWIWYCQFSLEYSDRSFYEEQKDYDESHLECCPSCNTLISYWQTFSQRFNIRAIALWYFIEINSKKVIDYRLYSLRVMIRDNDDGYNVCIYSY